MKWPIFIIIIYMCSSCTTESGTTIPVEYAGALNNMMQNGDISAKISLDTLSDKDHIYALGAISELKGEIQVFDGQPIISYAQEGSVALNSTFQVDATLLVYSRIDQWIKIPVGGNIKSMAQLENYVRDEAKKNGINVEQPFPFKIEGNMESVQWHVIDWPEGDTEHTHEKHIASGPQGESTYVKASILGFYSNHHKGIFTHHTSNMHLHANIPLHKVAGHVDDVTLGNGCILSLPLITSTND